MLKLEVKKCKIFTKVQSFLGLAGYKQRFVQGFSKIAMPLTDLTRKIVKYELTERCEYAFQELKKRLPSSPILALPSKSEGFVVYSDATHNSFVELLHFVLMITNPSVTICPSNVAPNTISKQA